MLAKSCYLAVRLLMLPLIALDALANRVLLGGPVTETMSAAAWKNRDHREWGWCHLFVDALFGDDHCRRQFEKEAKYGGVWSAWLASLKET